MTFTIHIGKICRQVRLSRELHALRQAIDLQNRTLGELTYAAHCGDLSHSGVLPELLRSLDGLHAQREARRREQTALQGYAVCAACGAANERRNFYCGACGKALGRQ